MIPVHRTEIHAIENGNNIHQHCRSAYCPKRIQKLSAVRYLFSDNTEYVFAEEFCQKCTQCIADSGQDHIKYLVFHCPVNDYRNGECHDNPCVRCEHSAHNTGFCVCRFLLCGQEITDQQDDGDQETVYFDNDIRM